MWWPHLISVISVLISVLQLLKTHIVTNFLQPERSKLNVPELIDVDLSVIVPALNGMNRQINFPQFWSGCTIFGYVAFPIVIQIALPSQCLEANEVFFKIDKGPKSLSFTTFKIIWLAFSLGN